MRVLVNHFCARIKKISNNAVNIGDTIWRVFASCGIHNGSEKKWVYTEHTNTTLILTIIVIIPFELIVVVVSDCGNKLEPIVMLKKVIRTAEIDKINAFVIVNKL